MPSRIMRLMTPFTLRPEHTAVLIIDFQIRLFQAMDETFAFRHAKNAEHLVYATSAFGLPLLVTEQKKLGKTMPSLHVPEETLLFEQKVNFSCLKHPGIADALKQAGRQQIVVGGMETHICVAQTVRDLLGAGYEVVVAGEAFDDVADGLLAVAEVEEVDAEGIEIKFADGVVGHAEDAFGPSA